jgi:magnesium-protoporphyrin O-methyltransferase
MTATEPTTDDKTIVRDYFNATGFDRWRRIYGDGEVNRVQMGIRNGHQKTVDRLLGWLRTEPLTGVTICDAGCGVGSLSIPLAETGAIISASDISEKMVGEAQSRAVELGYDNLSFSVQDLEAVTGRYNTVICLDVLIHYPTEKAAEMVAHLASMAEERLVISFAPKSPILNVLKKIGEFFPGPSKTTRAYQHAETDIVKMIEASGFTVDRAEMISAPFYFVRLLEAKKV